MQPNKQRKRLLRNHRRELLERRGIKRYIALSPELLRHNEKNGHAMHLPSSHRRSLSVTARIVEDSIDEIEKTLLKKEKPRSSSHITDSLDESTRQKILTTVTRLREANDAMFHTLHLEPNVFSETQIVRSRIVHLWAVLRDSKSKGLKRFGELPPDAAAEVDRNVDSLLGVLKELL